MQREVLPLGALQQVQLAHHLSPAHIQLGLSTRDPFFPNKAELVEIIQAKGRSRDSEEGKFRSTISSGVILGK